MLGCPVPWNGSTERLTKHPAKPSALHTATDLLSTEKQYWKIELDRVHSGSLGKEHKLSQGILVLPARADERSQEMENASRKMTLLFII